MSGKIFKMVSISALILISGMVIGPLIYGFIRGGGMFTASFFDEEIRFAFRMSLKTASISTVICMTLTVPATLYLYGMKGRWKYVVKALTGAMISLPHIVTGIMLLLFFGRQGIGQVLEGWGIDFVFTVSGIVLAQVIINVPYVMEQVWAAYEKIRPKAIFTARTLGADEVQVLRHVVLPGIRTDLAAAAVLCFSRALGEYGAVMMLAGSVRMKTEVLPTAILLNMSSGGIDRALAIACIMIVLAIVLHMAARLVLKRGERDAGVE